MALVNCGECNREISDKASACPHCGAKGKKKLKEILAGIVVVAIALTMLGQCVGSPSEKSKTASEEHGSPSQPSQSSAAAKTHVQTIGRSTSAVLGSIAVIERTSSPLRDGTPRENVKLSKYLALEAIGDKADLQSYTLMFGLAKDDKVSTVETGLLVATVLANTFPAWGKQGGKDTAVNWVGNATAQLGTNIKKNKDDPAPVVLERDGLRIRYTATPVLGIFFITVEPVTAT